MADYDRIDKLTPDPHNARSHNTRNVGMIEAAMREVGTARSIVIDEDGVILAGNATVQAAAAAGIDRVRVIEAAGDEIIAVQRIGLTPEQKTRLALFDNRSAELAEWDPDEIRALGAADLEGMFSEAELNELLAVVDPPGDVDAEPQIYKAEELRKQWGVEVSQLWQLGEHRLLCGDSTKAEDVAGVLCGEKPHLMVTDPPYGVEYDANWRNEATRSDGSPIGASAVGVVANDDRADWTPTWDLFPGDVAYVWHAGVRASEVQVSLEASRFKMRAQIIWAKNVFAIGRGDYHWKHEPCWYAVREGKTGHWNGDRSQATVWDIDKPRQSETGHSTQKPVECMAKPIDNNSKLGDAVYEPFSGSGTTIIACEQLGRRCRAIEISPGYVAVTLQRYLDATGKTPERISPK